MKRIYYMDNMKVGFKYYIKNTGNEEFLAEVVSLSVDNGIVTSVTLRNYWSTRESLYSGKIMFFTGKHPITSEVMVYEIEDESEVMMVQL